MQVTESRETRLERIGLSRPTRLGRITSDFDSTLTAQRLMSLRPKLLNRWQYPIKKIDRYTIGGHDIDPLEFEDSVHDEHELMQAPLVRHPWHVLTDVIYQGASNIHVIPTDHGYDIYLRVDGFLVKQLYAPQQLERCLIPRIEVTVNLDFTKSDSSQLALW